MLRQVKAQARAPIGRGARFVELPLRRPGEAVRGLSLPSPEPWKNNGNPSANRLSLLIVAGLAQKKHRTFSAFLKGRHMRSLHVDFARAPVRVDVEFGQPA